MSAIPQLWLPILATAIFIFIASSLIHMVFKWHNSDYRKLANEDDVRAVIRAGSPTPGQYILPHCTDGKDMQSEAMKQKFMEGPIAFMTVRANGMPNMGVSLGSWFALSVVIAALAGMVGMYCYGAKGDSHLAAHAVGVVTFMTYGGGSIQMGIWMGKPWGSVAKDMLDCLIYAVISALTFTWLWPAAA